MRTQTTDMYPTMLGVLLFAEISPSEAKLFLYDEGNTPIGMMYRTSTDTDYTTFWFEKNLQGDIVAVYSADGVKQVSYAYDAWGMPFYTIHVSGTKAYENPFLYRGYYYEEDLTLYRTQTRLYDPYMGRFVSPDLLDVITASPMALTDKNLYIYCDNNPVTRVDPDGEFWHILIGAAAGAIISGVTTLVSNAIQGQPLTDGLTTSMVAGAASGALAATGVGVVGMVAGNAAISMAENAVNQVVENEGFNNFDFGDMLVDGVIDGTLGAFGGPGKGSKHLTNLGKQTIKRTFNAGKHKGLKAGLKEAGKAFAYYGKSTAKYYKKFLLRDLPADVVSNVVLEIASSDYMKHQYRRILGR